MKKQKNLTAAEKFAYAVQCMRERHTRGDRPLRGRLTAIGDPSSHPWKGGHERHWWKLLATYKRPEVELAACAIGVLFLCDLTAAAGTFTDIGARVGLTWQACGSLIALNDHGADFSVIGDAAEHYGAHPEMSAQQALGDVMQRLHAAIPGYDVKHGIWMAQSQLHMCEATANDVYKFTPPAHITAGFKAKQKAVTEAAAMYVSASELLAA
jgi:hypothetical protein